jgi:hypothetical protein
METISIFLMDPVMERPMLAKVQILVVVPEAVKVKAFERVRAGVLSMVKVQSCPTEIKNNRMRKED